MEAILREWASLGLTDAQLGILVRILYHYIDTATIPEGSDQEMVELFKSKYEKLVAFKLKDRARGMRKYQAKLAKAKGGATE